MLTHTIVHPNLGPAELDAMVDWQAELQPAGWKCYTLWGPPTKASPTGGWFLDDEEVGFPFLERVRALGPRVVATHKGSAARSPTRRSRRRRRATSAPRPRRSPTSRSSCTTRGTSAIPVAKRARTTRSNPTRGVDRFVASSNAAGIGPGDNVYAELGTTWFLMLRRPREAAHVLGKLLRALGPGTDRVGHRLRVVRIAATADRRVPRLHDPRGNAGEFGYPPLTARREGTDP